MNQANSRTESRSDKSSMNIDEMSKAASLGLMTTNKRSPLRWLVPTMALVLVVGATAWYLWPQDPAAGQMFKTDAATLGNLSVTVTATGSVEPKDEVEVSSELSGIMAEVLVDYNDQVTKGQPLARLDTTTLSATVLEKQSSLKSAKANVVQAKASLEEAQLDYRNYQTAHELSGGKFPSQQTLDSARIAVTKAEASVEVAEASVAVADADLKSAQTDLVKATLVSPIDGVVLSKDVEAGQTIASSYSAPTLFLLAKDLKSMELHVDIDEADIAQIKTGQHATFTVDAWGDRLFNATITQIRLASTDDDDSSSSVVSYETILSVDNSDLALLPSMTAVTDIAVQSAQNALTVSTAALRYQPTQPDSPSGEPSPQASSGGLFGGLMPGARFRKTPTKKSAEEIGSSIDGGHATLWVLRDNFPEPVDVVTGMSDGLRTEILSGDIQAGDEIIIDSVSVNQ